MPVSDGHIVIEAVRPELDGGRYRAKAIVGDHVEITADILRDGPAALQAAIRFRAPSGQWQESPMVYVDNDRWAGSFHANGIGCWLYTIEAWTDRFGTWRRDLVKKAEARQAADLDLQEGAVLIREALRVAAPPLREVLEGALEQIGQEPHDAPMDARLAAALDPAVLDIMAGNSERTDSTTYEPTLEITIDRERARFGAWYEFFPRSTGVDGAHGTFQSAGTHLATVAEMGFDVVYLPPIHPIGRTHRKGKNNALTAAADDVGSPWAIGNEYGGHKSVDPGLGSIDDFDAFVKTAEQTGVEIALDFAIQCSPDHPWVKEHPEWFHHRPDGSIMYAENPPKKYQDIYPINFDTHDRDGLWNELKSVLEFWIAHGIKIFRVDNPHTKPFAFWEWVIDEIQRERPEVIFLSEAFTRPKVMRLLAKLGFTQSYTYFTWRNDTRELTEYLIELTQTEVADYFRPNFFTNTQDILHEYLQSGGAPAFKIRLVLASLLSPTYGIYSGFEFYENLPLQPGSEEYLDSEKYQLRHRDWSRQQGTLIPYIRRINQIRKRHPAFSQLTNLRFHDSDNEMVLAFSKTAIGHRPIVVIVTLDPYKSQEATVTLDVEQLGLDVNQKYELHELISGSIRPWDAGSGNRVALDPVVEPANIFSIEA
jgi:starch synthase (maltosyl-transferring)